MARARPVPSGIVTYIAAMDVIFGIAIAGIDLHAGLPRWWTLGESTTIMATGIVIAILNLRALRPS